MASKPITVARRDYMNTIIDVTNNSELPAFVVAEILEKILSQVKEAETQQLKHDEAEWHKACAEAQKDASEVTDDGGQEDK